MRAGTLRHLVDLQSPSVAQNAYGEPIESWTTYASVWAAIQPLSARETAQAPQATPIATHVVMLRYLSTVTAGHRLKFGTRYLNVESVINTDERNRELQLQCKEVQE
jgi:SPP1 family predicted phage head-tail adaptor